MLFYVLVCAHLCGAHGGPQRVLNPYEVELQVAIYVGKGNQTSSFERPGSLLTPNGCLQPSKIVLLGSFTVKGVSALMTFILITVTTPPSAL